MRKITGFFLYLLLIYVFIQGWIEREARQKPGIETLISALLVATPQNLSLTLETPTLLLNIEEGQLDCQFQYQDQVFFFRGKGCLDYNALDFEITTTGDLATLLKHFSLQSLFVSGEYQLKTHVSGPWGNPLFSYNLTTANASFENLSTGTLVQHIDIIANSKDNQLVVETLSGDDGQGGFIKGNGVVELSEGFPYLLNFEIDHSQLIKLDHLSAIFTGNLALKGDVNKAELSGQLSTKSFDLALNENKPSPKTIEVIYSNPPEKNTRTTQPKAEWPLNLNIQINAKKNIWIVDDSLKSEWKASVDLRGSQGHYEAYGSLELLQGQYNVNGKIVNLKEGKISFAGDPVKETTLSVKGIFDTNTIIAEALVSGPLTNPSLSLRSNPPLPQADILSHIIFGHGLADMTPQQSRHLRKSIKDMAAMSTGTNILDSIRNGLGIDRIEINHTGGSALDNVSLQVGKYLTKGLYVAFNRGISTPSNRVILEAALLSNVKLQGEIGDNAEGELHLKWRLDY